jgi:Raf kinase inhibitor-like YbhB/YbcL family protein
MKVTLLRSAIAGIALASLAGIALAQAPAAPPAGGAPAGGAPAAPTVAPDFIPKTIWDTVTTASTPKLTLTSADIKEGQQVPDTFSQNGANKSPQLTWTAGPAGTKAYVVATQDPYMGRPTPVQHWIVWNIPADVTMLPQGVPTTATLDSPKGAVQATVGTAAGYRGPKPPAGQTHQYVYQVFALDGPLTVADPTKANADSIAALMKGHVLAAGKLTAPYAGK